MTLSTRIDPLTWEAVLAHDGRLLATVLDVMRDKAKRKGAKQYGR